MFYNNLILGLKALIFRQLDSQFDYKYAVRTYPRGLAGLFLLFIYYIFAIHIIYNIIHNNIIYYIVINNINNSNIDNISTPVKEE